MTDRVDKGWDWSVVIGLWLGIATGIGIPGLYGVFTLVRMENRVTNLEASRVSDQEWRVSVSQKIDTISEGVNRLIGAQQAK